MGHLKPVSNIVVFTILFTSLIFHVIPTEIAFADDKSEKDKLEKEREQAKKEKERLEEEQKKADERAREDSKHFEERLKESLKLDFGDGVLPSGNIGDWVLAGTIILIVGVVGSTGYKIMKPKKQKIRQSK